MMELMAEQFPGCFSGYKLHVAESHQRTKVRLDLACTPGWESCVTTMIQAASGSERRVAGMHRDAAVEQPITVPRQFVGWQPSTYHARLQAHTIGTRRRGASWLAAENKNL